MDAIVGGIVGKLIKPVTDLISEFIEDKDKANELAYKVSTMAATQAHEQTIAQIEVNKQEAAHKSLFVAGWRPGTGWICTLVIANNYLIVPYVNLLGAEVPVLDAATLFPVLMGLLGLGTMRSFEKSKGVAREK